MDQSFELVIIGGGTAGLAAVSEALELGVQSIALIEQREELGGECTLYGCIPSNTQLEGVRILKLLQEQIPEYGVEKLSYHFAFDQLRKKKQDVIFEGGYDFMEDPRVTVIQATATFLDPHTVQVGEQTLRGEKFIVATGAEAILPTIQGLEDIGFLTFKQANHLKHRPESLIILGGGSMGVEFAQMFQWFGTQVTLVEQADRLVTDEEPEISHALEDILKREGVQVMTQCRADSFFHSNESQKCLRLYQGEQETVLAADEVLVATGMKPKKDTLNLAAAGIQVREADDAILVNAELQTTSPHIWAIGDVIGQYRFTSVADYHAVLAVQNAFTEVRREVNYLGMGWSVHTIPTIAHTGLTETEARAQYAHVETAIIPVTKVSRYRIESEEEGFIKVIFNADTDEILGGHILASQGEEVAHLLMLAMRQKLTTDAMLDLIYIYPSKTQLVQKALEEYRARKLAQHQQAASEASPHPLQSQQFSA